MELNEIDNRSSGSRTSDGCGTSHNIIAEPSLEKILLKQNELSSILIEQQALAQLPNNEPAVFDRSDITKYRTFIVSFDRVIETLCTNNFDRYYYLQRYTSGRLKKLVLSFNNEDPSNSYQQARKVLQKNYGDEFLIAHKHLEKLDQWPSVASEDVSALDELATYLAVCNNMMGNMSHLNQKIV